MNEKGIDYFRRAAAAPQGPEHPCVVCDQGMIEAASYEICEFCGWEDDPVQNTDPDFTGGANQMSLKQAKAYWNATRKRVTCGNGSPEMNEIQRMAIGLIEKQQ